MSFGLDYAWGPRGSHAHLSPAAHHAVGSTFACRYLSHDDSKNLNRAEADTLRTGGIDVVVAWETVSQRCYSGRQGGQEDARAALAQANACGMPEGRPIYFAPADFDAPEGAQPAIDDYFLGISDVLGKARTGAYLGYWPLKRLFDAGLVTYGWQTYAWSGGNVERRAALYQYSNAHVVGGHDVDFDRSLKDDFGQWGYRRETDPAHGHFKAAINLHYDPQKHIGTWSVDRTPSPDAHFGDAEWWAVCEHAICMGGARRGEHIVRGKPRAAKRPF